VGVGSSGGGGVVWWLVGGEGRKDVAGGGRYLTRFSRGRVPGDAASRGAKRGRGAWFWCQRTSRGLEAVLTPVVRTEPSLTRIITLLSGRRRGDNEEKGSTRVREGSALQNRREPSGRREKHNEPPDYQSLSKATRKGTERY
jgi:hypothetical protein